MAGFPSRADEEWRELQKPRVDPAHIGREPVAGIDYAAATATLAVVLAFGGTPDEANLVYRNFCSRLDAPTLPIPSAIAWEVQSVLGMLRACPSCGIQPQERCVTVSGRSLRGTGLRGMHVSRWPAGRSS